MTFDYIWMLLIALAFVAGVIVPLYFVLRKKWNEQTHKHYYANTSRLTLTPKYKSLLKVYKIGLSSIIGLLVISMISLIAISAKPVKVETTTPIKYNRDIVLCLDASGSMADVNVAILDKFSNLVDSFRGERISLVLFNSIANQVFPLTDDYNYIQEQFEKVKLGLQGDFESYDIFTYTITGEGASLIGDGLTACTQSFDNSNSFERRSRSIVLATDNLINGVPIITLPEAVDIAIRDEIKVFAIFPEYTRTLEELVGVSREQFIRAGDELRSEILRTGGQFYNQGDGLLVPSIVEQIEKEQATAIESKPIVVKTDEPNVFIWLIIISVGLSLLVAWRLKV